MRDKLIEERILKDEKLLDRVIKKKQEQLDALLKSRLSQRNESKFRGKEMRKKAAVETRPDTWVVEAHDRETLHK